MRTAGIIRRIGCIDRPRVGQLVPLEGRGPFRPGPNPGEGLVRSDMNLAGMGEQSVGDVALPS